MVTPAHAIPEQVRRLAAAFHEAGHAIVAITLGRKVTGAILRPPNGLSGETQFENEPERWLDLNQKDDRHVAEDALVVLLAGQIAEAAYWHTVSANYRPFVDSHRDDEHQIREMMAGFCFAPEEEGNFRAHCENRAKKILDRDQSKTAIVEIANRLATALSVSRAELDEILNVI